MEIVVKPIRQIVKLSLFLTLLVISGCSQNNEQPKTDINTQAEQVVPHKTSLTGSLVKDSENTPDQFFKMTVNDRHQFKNEQNQVNGHLEQIISNPDQSLIIVAIWENLGEKWRCMGITISTSNQITADTSQVLLRLPFRLIDSSTISNAFRNNTAYTQLNNGAGLTIEQKENRINYLLY